LQRWLGFTLAAWLCFQVLPLTGCGGGNTPTFTVTPAASSLTIYPGSTQTLSVAVAGNGHTPIAVSMSGLPTGITATSSPGTVAPGGTVVLTLTAAVNANAAAFPASAPNNPNSATTNVNVSGAAGSTVVTAPVALTVSLSNTGFAPAAGQIDLPIVKIDTGNTPIVSTETDVSGTLTITSADGSTTYLPGKSDTDNTATFHVHGHSTAQMPKLPYEMKLGTSVDLLSLLGVQCPYVTSSGKATCDKSKTYILLANYDDKSLLRDWAASALANGIPYGDGTNGYLSETPGSPTPSGTDVLMPWAPHSLFIELFVNGQYEGNYQLIEKVNVDSHRINIPELTSTSADVSGGYQMEIDQRQSEGYVFFTPTGLPIGLNDPDFSSAPIVYPQILYIHQYVSTAENALFSANYTDPKLGWRAYFDEAALVNYYLVMDVMGNVDGGSFYSSDYLYKTVGNPLLYMGPVWDFDVAAGNVNYQPIVSPTVPWMQVQASWYKQLFTDPGFRADVLTQWNTLKKDGVLTNWVASIGQQSSALTQSAQNNFARWPMIGETVWPNPSAQGNYADSVSAFTDWLNQRIGYLDSVLNGGTQSSVRVTSGPATAVQAASVRYTIRATGSRGVPTGKVTLLLAGRNVGSADLDSSGTAVITAAAPVTGALHPLVTYSGDKQYAIAQAMMHGH
jgi:hypothetical protein